VTQEELSRGRERLASSTSAYPQEAGGEPS
jgi:hypothetical protein